MTPGHRNQMRYRVQRVDSNGNPCFMNTHTVCAACQHTVGELHHHLLMPSWAGLWGLQPPLLAVAILKPSMQ
jgi:hypothetical protein